MKKNKSKYWIVDVENTSIRRSTKTRYYFDTFKDAIEFMIALHKIETNKFVVIRRNSKV